MGVTGAQQHGNEKVAAPHFRARIADDSGSSLIVVLIFIMGFSVMITALLGFSSTALTANKKATDIARQLEAADAGVELALERIRGGVASGVGGSASTASFNVNNDAVGATIAQRAVTVICIDGPFGVGAGMSTYKVGTAAACPAGNTLPYGAAWSITSAPPGVSSIDAGGKLTGPAGAYTIRAQIGNVSATKNVNLP